MTNKANGSRDFPRTTVSALKRKGITFVGTTWLPGAGGSFANGLRGYLLNDNGTQRIRTYLDVQALALEAS